MAVVIAFALILAAFLRNRAKPRAETDQPSAEFVSATRKCAECHARTQYSVVHEYEMSLHARKNWWARPQIWMEGFAILNVGFLTFDIYLAHSVNQFRNEAEYLPLIFSAGEPLVLILALAVRDRWPAVWKDLSYLVGWMAVFVGLTGVILHLESHFFYERTLRSLTYSAPFAAPLAYPGLGFLIIMNRMADPESLEWAQWVLLALGGFMGNFVFSLADHAGNGFFNLLEGVLVVASAIAVGLLAVPLFMPVSRQNVDLCVAILLLEAWAGGALYCTRRVTYGDPLDSCL
jgi:hypothetical protein